MSKGRIKIAIAFLAATSSFALLGAACATQPGDTSNNSTLRAGNTNPPGDRGDRVVTGGDLQFMTDAAQGGMMEVELGRLAATRATNAEVRQFAERMVTDHGRAGQELMQLASQKRVTLPSEMSATHRQAMERLSRLSGAEFDREYVRQMVTDHERDVTNFGAVSNNATDMDVKAFATRTLPTLREHQQMIGDIAGRMDRN